MSRSLEQSKEPGVGRVETGIAWQREQQVHRSCAGSRCPLSKGKKGGSRGCSVVSPRWRGGKVGDEARELDAARARGLGKGLGSFSAESGQQLPRAPLRSLGAELRPSGARTALSPVSIAGLFPACIN